MLTESTNPETPRVSSAQHALRTDELDFDLPSDRIATRPAEPRDSARMLVMSRSRDGIEHRIVRDLPEYLRPGDALVFNTTAVAPARLVGRRIETGGKVEGLFLRESNVGEDSIQWRVMLKSGGRLKEGDRVELLGMNIGSPAWTMRLREKRGDEWEVAIEKGEASTAAALDDVGRTPLPPYILKARGNDDVDDAVDRQWYQTVFADASRRQSVAAPTAGLHFTPELLKQLEKRGVERIDITLHVGPGTFKPVTAATLAEHPMHAEWFEVSAEAQAKLTRIRSNHSGRVFGIGTTSVRALESLPENLEPGGGQMCGPSSGLTDLMIAPPYEFKHVDGMLTNFHLPRSTLLALVAAMVGLDRLKSVYREAIDRGYRFYSYGDAMLILP
jgi:S-adenosylmethionine:tRNA ribosyltransferase-isomerase